MPRNDHTGLLNDVWSGFVQWSGWDWHGWGALTAVGTVGAVIVALFLSERASRRRDRERRRGQAEHLTAWLGPHGSDPPERPLMDVTIRNDSSQLAYRVIVSMVPVRGTASPDFRAKLNLYPTDFRVFIGELPPGLTLRTMTYPGGGMSIRWAVEVAFRDAAGQGWLRTTDGQLKQIDKDPAEYYGLYEPLDW